MDLKEFVNLINEYYQECAANPHGIVPEVRFYLDDDSELELDFDSKKCENSSYAVEVYRAGGCGCWLDIDIHLRKKI